jgi:hypothetical protein
MADDHKEDPVAEAKKFAYFVFGSVAVLLGVWYITGGPERSDLRGIFLKPPPPLNTGESYGPTVPTGPTSTNNR